MSVRHLKIFIHKYLMFNKLLSVKMNNFRIFQKVQYIGRQNKGCFRVCKNNIGRKLFIVNFYTLDV